MIRFATIALVLLSALPAAAQGQTDPLVLAHPETGEAGVWIPSWLQKEFLLTEAKLGSCLEKNAVYQLELEQRRLQITELREASVDLTVSVDQLKTHAADLRTRAEEAEGAAQDRLLWAMASTGGATVAILLLILEAI